MEAEDKANNRYKPKIKLHGLMFYHARIKCLEKNKMVQCMGNVHGVSKLSNSLLMVVSSS